jgi:arsenite-transporting ATPase
LRVLLFTGKGGVGKSTLAAATAALAAAAGQRTLVLSTDAAHSLADAFGTPVGAEPTLVAPNLYVEQVDAQLRFEQSWADIQRYLLSVLDVAGMDPVAAEELTVIPGAEEVLALLELRLRARSGEWDLVIVDCAPTAETLRLLALPEALGWYMARVFPMQRRLVKTLKPVLTRAAGVPMPGGGVFDALQRLHDELLEVRDLLSGPSASVRLVLTPETVVLAEARRSYTMLSLYGYRVDGVVANRVFPAEGADDWRAGWVLAQDEVLADVDASFPGLPIWRSVYRPGEPVGVPALEALAREVYAGQPVDPLAPATGEGPFRVTRSATGAVARLALPGATKDQVQLARNGDDLVVTVGSYRRLMTLPQGLARLSIAGARVDGGELQVRFVERSAPPAEEPGAGDQPGRRGQERQ